VYLVGQQVGDAVQAAVTVWFYCHSGFKCDRRP
jgi:hypothetical protein